MSSGTDYVAALQDAFPEGGEIQEQQATVERVLGVDPSELRQVLFKLYDEGHVTVKPHFEGTTVTFTVSW